MKKMLLVLIAAVLTTWAQAAWAAGPHHINGFELGGDISEFEARLRPKSAMPVRHMEYLTEVEVKDSPGFQSGMVYYGNCAASGKVVWIKLKYRDSSRKFYDQLLKKFTSRFGEPEVWKGDPFQVVISWKWSFNEGTDDQISMILQHNTKDSDEKLGNVIKIKLSKAMDQERLCYEKGHPEPDDQPSSSASKPDWDALLPY